MPIKFSTLILILALIAGALSSCNDGEADEIRQMEEELIAALDPTADWMQKLIWQYPNREARLLDICLPRSHDAGMYIIQNCTVGANACSVQTQHRDMRTQLKDGIRNFDIRPLYKNNAFFTRHSQGCDGPGCYGVRVETMLSQLRDFLDEHAELVILEFSFWCYTDGDDPVFREMVQSILGDRLYKESSPESIPFIKRPLADIIPPEEGTGKAIALVGQVTDPASSAIEGFFPNSFVPVSGSFSNAQNFPDMKTDQFSKYTNFSNDGNRLYEISWTLTQDVDQALSCVLPGNQQSIESLAAMANPNLSSSIDELMASELIVKGRIPNIISIDFCEEFVTEECIRISELNLED